VLLLVLDLLAIRAEKRAPIFPQLFCSGQRGSGADLSRAQARARFLLSSNTLMSQMYKGLKKLWMIIQSALSLTRAPP